MMTIDVSDKNGKGKTYCPATTDYVIVSRPTDGILQETVHGDDGSDYYVETGDFFNVSLKTDDGKYHLVQMPSDTRFSIFD